MVPYDLRDYLDFLNLEELVMLILKEKQQPTLILECWGLATLLFSWNHYWFICCFYLRYWTNRYSWIQCKIL